MAKSRSATRSVPVRRATAAASAPPHAPASPQLFLDLAGVAVIAIGVGMLFALGNARLAGPLGRWSVVLLRLFVGHGVYLSPIAFTLLGIGLITRSRPNRTGLCQIGLVGAGLVILAWLHLLSWGEHDRFVTSVARVAWLFGSKKDMALVERVDGGLVGALVTMALSPVGLAGSYIVLVAAAVSSALLITETSFGTMAGRVRDRSRRIAEIMAEREAARLPSRDPSRDREGAATAAPMHQPRPSAARRKGPFIDLDDPPAPLPAAADDPDEEERQESDTRTTGTQRRAGIRIPGLGLFVGYEPRGQAAGAPGAAAPAEDPDVPAAAASPSSADTRAAAGVTHCEPEPAITALVPVEPDAEAAAPRHPPAVGTRATAAQTEREPVRMKRYPASRRPSSPPAPASGDWGEYVLPPLDLLETPTAVSRRSSAEADENIAILENTLREFRIEAQVVEIADGPTVTRYELRLGEGIRVKKIVDLADNIKMDLASYALRVEAPIPGKSAIGIEVPKKARSLVSLRECVECESFQNSPSKISFVLGKNVAGEPQHADLARMPHLLVAGATNSGKSVCLNALIASMLIRARPDELKFLFIDPKRVELTLFDGIPHLWHPVVKDVKQAAGILRWALKEMDRRYDLFTQVMTRNITGYNEKMAEKPEKRLPYLVIVIDELADLMMQQGPEVEQAICRLAQLARATGIHLVVATQRPSVDVITGLIKANVPSRIAFGVTSQVDSRTILDQKGAEDLVGRGDMLFKPVDATKPMRIQGAFVSEDEVVRLVEHLKTQGRPEYIAQALTVDSGAIKSVEEDAEDDMFEPATRFIVTTGHASTSSLQRKFKIGYTRAARLVDMMEARGVVGPLDGAKPREILMSRAAVEDMFANLRNSLSQDNDGAADDDLDDFFDEEEIPDAGGAAEERESGEPFGTASPTSDPGEIAHRGGAAGWSVEDEADNNTDDLATPSTDLEDPFEE